MKTPVDWLLSGPACVEYLTRRELLGEPEGSPSCADAKRRMKDDPQIAEMFRTVNSTPWPVLTGHRSPAHPLQLLSVLVDLGFKAEDGLETAAAWLKSNRENGMYCIPIAISKGFGGDGLEHNLWILCDAPLTFSCLNRLGALDAPEAEDFARKLEGFASDAGFKCRSHEMFGSFRGPGRKEDPCPYAGLVSLKALSSVPGFENSEAARQGVESILTQWKDRRNAHPYMFYMGTDFCKPKAPLVWFDIVHVTDVLSRFAFARKDPRFADMAETLFSQADEEGRFTPGSVYQYYKGWDFGQKKEPSRYLTVLAHRTAGWLDSGES